MLRKSILIVFFFTTFLFISSHISFADYDSFTLNVPNSQGGYVAVILKKSGNGYVGPRGEYYSDFPTVYTLQSTYGVPDYVQRERMLEQQADETNKANMQREIEQQKWADEQMQESIRQQNARVLAQQQAEAGAEQEAQEQAQEQAKQAAIEQQHEQVQAQQAQIQAVPRKAGLPMATLSWQFVLGFFVVFGFILYFLPSIIALNRKHSNFASIIILNIFLGWTILGWVGALVWSFTRQQKNT